MKLFLSNLFSAIAGFVKAHTVVSIITAVAVVTVGIATPIIVSVTKDNDTNHEPSSSISASADDNSSESESGTDTTSTDGSDTSTSELDGSSDTSDTNSNGESEPSSTTGSSKPTESSKPSSSTNTSSTNKPTTSTPSTSTPSTPTETSKYYDESRITSLKFTPETLANSVQTYVESNNPASITNGENGAYTLHYTTGVLAGGFNNFDVFGYNLTEKEFLGDGIGQILIDVEKYDTNDDVKVKYFNSSFCLNLESEDDVVRAINRDVAKFKQFLSGDGDPYITFNGTSDRGFENITDNMIKSVVNGNSNLNDNSGLLQIFTSQDINTQNHTLQFQLLLSATKSTDGYVYQLNFHITKF